jgi:repressor LexA
MERVTGRTGNGDSTPPTRPHAESPVAYRKVEGLSARQNEVVSYIKDFRSVKGYAPTIREIAEHFGVCTNAIACTLAILKRQNVLTWKKNMSRSIRFIGETSVYVKDEHVERVEEFIRSLE